MNPPRRVSKMRIVGGADSPDVARDVIEATDEENAEDGGPASWFWRCFFRLFTLAVYLAAVLAVLAMFWGLWLAARALFRAMGVA